jgi:bacillithiol biosynthesis deacetylase BshB1
MRLDVLVICAHPDDAEIGCGGLIAKYIKNGYKVGILDLTDGEPTPYGDVETRLRESQQASKILGVSHRINLNLPNRILEDTLENRIKISEVIREYSPTVIITHPPKDWHPDHIACHHLVNAAKFHAKLSKTDSKFEPFSPKHVYYFNHKHQKSPQPIDFLVDISEYMEIKNEALSAYRSQFIDNPKNRHFISELTEKAAYFGSLIRTAYAEAFQSPEYIKIEDITTL